MKKNQKINTLLFYFGSLALITNLSNVYKNPNTFEKYFQIDPFIFLIIFITISLFIKIKLRFEFSQAIKKINNKIILPISAIISIFLTFLDYQNHPNFVFGKFFINYDKLGIIAITSFSFLLISLKSLYWIKNYKKIIFFFPLLLYLMFSIIKLWPFDFFKKIVQEDNFVENTQFFVVLISSIISFLIAKYFIKINKIFFILYLIFTIILFLIAGDEISWGQRILNYKTPQKIEIQNTQNELTFHNLESVVNYIWIIYLIISIYGSLSHLLKFPIKYQKIFNFFSIPWFASSYFIFSLIYHSIALPWKNHHIGDWSEITELVMYLGIFFYCLNIHNLLFRHQRMPFPSRLYNCF